VRNRTRPVVFLFLAGVLGCFGAARAQDLSTFLKELPEPGAWVRYRITKQKDGGPEVKPLELSVTGSSVVNREPYLRLEVWPYKFHGHENGTLQMLIKARPTEKEALNPFLHTLSVAYSDPKEEAFRLSDGALGLLRSQAENVEIHQELFDTGVVEAVEAGGGGPVRCRKQRRVTTVRTRLLGKTVETTEDGIYWFSDRVPFGLAKAEITRTVAKKGETTTRRIIVLAEDFAFSGAVSRFAAPPEKEKGILGLLFD